MKTLKTSDIVAAYQLISAAKIYNINSTGDKRAILKTACALKKIANEFEDFRNSVIESLKGENHDEMVILAKRWRKEEEAKCVTLTKEEQENVNVYFFKYNDEVAKCVNEDLAKEHELELKTISEASFDILISNNEWNVEQILLLEVMFT